MMRTTLTCQALALLWVLSAANAQEVLTLPPVFVTAKGYAADDLETPVATTTVDRDQLLRRNAQNVGDALRGEAGLAVNSDGAQGLNPVIRGLKKESIVLLVDGMRFNSAQPVGAIASFMSLGLADRVEVVKGPASVLYGTGALGGVINVRLPQAAFLPGTFVETTASYDSASGGLRGSGIANFSQGNHALMAGASVARIDDYDAESGKVDLTAYDSDSFIAQYRFRIDDAQQLRVSLQRHRDEDVWHPGSTKPFTTPPVSAPFVMSTTMYGPEQERTLVELGYSREGSGDSPFNVDLRAYQQEMKRDLNSWSHGLNRDITIIDTGFKTTGIDAKADWQLDPRHLLSFGVNAWELTSSPERTVAAPPHTMNFYRADPFDDGKIRTIGFFVQDDMRFDRLNVLAALRHDTVKGSAYSVANPANPVFGARNTANLDRSDDDLSGSLGASYEIAPLFRPYASLSYGFRAAEMRERYESGPRNDGYYYVGNPQIKPETSTHIEAGLKGQSDRIEYSMAVWRDEISDYMSGRDISGTTRAIALCGANAGACKETVSISEVVLDGFEAQGKWQAWQGHWLKVVASVVRGDNKELNEPLFQMPADELSLGWEGAVANAWTADITWRLVREQDRVAAVFARGSENRTAGFGTLDAGATWQYAQNQWVRIAMKNLNDKGYHEHLTEGVSGQEIEAPGRSLQLVWQGKF